MQIMPTAPNPELDALIASARAFYENMSPEQRAEMHEAQRQSWLRSCEPCEHGNRDWEDCTECRARYAK